MRRLPKVENNLLVTNLDIIGWEMFTPTNDVEAAVQGGGQQFSSG